MGYSKSRKAKGAPMYRNFGVGKPGVPNNDEFKNPYANETPAPVTNSNETNKDINNETQDNNNNNVNNQVENNKYGEFGNKTKTNSGIDRWIDKPILEVLGLTKKQIAARKAKKEEKYQAAKKAQGEGTETLKQAKLITKNKKKENKQAIRNIKKTKKNNKKLAKYKEKNPVTGKEAIKLVTGGGSKDLV